MAETAKQLAATALTTTLTTTLYTTPSSTTTIITSIVVSNTSASTRNVTIDAAGGMNILSARPLAPGETLILHPRSAITAAQLIRGGQDTGTDVEVLISGVEIT